MIMAGHTQDGDRLQSALGYGRAFFNCTSLMILIGASNYFTTVIPGCIGAGRKDRIPNYLWRSLLLVTMLMVPFIVLQLFAAQILFQFGVPSHIAAEVGVYCRLMIITALLLILETHLETIFINLGYARCATFNSLITGVGIDTICTYFLIYKLDLGTTGAACAQIVVKASRNIVWLVLILYYGLFSTIFITTKRQVLLSRKEVIVFFKLAVPSILNNFSGWLIYELQIMALANINGISTPALAAGAIWVQSESALAAVQQGWTQITMMRTIKLLGKRDPGAWKSYTILCILSELVVAVCNIPLLLWGEDLSTVVSNDPDVRRWFGKIIWVLALHSQIKISAVNAGVLFIPMGKAILQIAVNTICFYIIATPVTAVVSLTDMVTSSVSLKLTICLATTPMASSLIGIFEYAYLSLMDWSRIAKVINDRANTDKEQIISS
jgi:Na+-driven multidrug efflux pump